MLWVCIWEINRTKKRYGFDKIISFGNRTRKKNVAKFCRPPPLEKDASLEHLSQKQASFESESEFGSDFYLVHLIILNGDDDFIIVVKQIVDVSLNEHVRVHGETFYLNKW